MVLDGPCQLDARKQPGKKLSKNLCHFNKTLPRLEVAYFKIL